MIQKNHLIVGFAVCLLVATATFAGSYALRREQMIHLLQPELIATALFFLFFIGFMLLHAEVMPKTKPKTEGTEPKTDTDANPVVEPKPQIPPDKAPDPLQIKDLEDLLKTEKERVLQLAKLLQEVENQRNTFKEKVDLNIQYCNNLNHRYKDLLDIAGGTDDRTTTHLDVIEVWRILISLGLHQYDYMKKISEPENCRPEQNANIRMVLEGISIGALDPTEYRLYTEDGREMEWRYMVLRRRLQQVGIDTLEDVLISGVRI